MTDKYHVFAGDFHEGDELIGSYLHPNDAIKEHPQYDIYEAYIVNGDGDLIPYCHTKSLYGERGDSALEWELEVDRTYRNKVSDEPKRSG